MASGQDFVETLKRIKYPNAHKLKGSSFDYLFTEKNVLPFLTKFCTLSEENVLSSEELAEYAALTPSDLAELETIELVSEKSKFSDEEIKAERRWLEDHFEVIRVQTEVLEKQRDIYKEHEKFLSKEKDDYEAELDKEKRKLRNLENEKIPQTEKKLISLLKSICETSNELDTVLNKTSADDIYFPSKETFKRDAEEYLAKEKKILFNVKFYLESHLEQFKSIGKDADSKVEDTSAVDFQEKLMQDTLFLRKVLKVSKEESIKAEVAKEKLEGEIKFYETLKDDSVFQNYDLPDSQLKEKLEKAQESLEMYKKQEDKLLADVKSAINNNLGAHCEQIAAACCEEKMKCYKSYLNKMAIPFDILVGQKARLEFFLMFLSVQEKTLLNVKDMLHQVTEELKTDSEEFSERKTHYEHAINKEVSNEVEYLSEDSVLYHLNNILENHEDCAGQNSIQITSEEVLKKVESLHEEEFFMKKQCEDKLNSNIETLELLEKQFLSLENVVSGNHKESEKIANLERYVDVELNKLDIKQHDIEETLRRQSTEYLEKSKMIARNKYLSRARKLYVNSMMNEKVFHKHIQEIKKAAENENTSKNQPETRNEPPTSKDSV